MRTVSAHVAATGTKEGLQPYLKQLTARLPPVRTVTVINPDGVILTDLRPGEPAKGYKVPDRAYFRAHFPPEAVDEYFYSPPIKSRLDGLTQITLSLAVRRANDDLVAVVASSIDDRFFSALSQELKVLGRFDARILYKDGRDVYALHELAPAGAEHSALVNTMVRLFNGSKTFHRKQIAIPFTDLRFQLSLPAVSYIALATPLVVRGSLIIGLILSLLTMVWWLAHRGRIQIIESEQRFKDFAETTSDYFWEMDADLRFSYISEHFEKTTSVPPPALLGKTREEMGIPNVDPDAWAKHLADLKAHRGFDNFVHPRTKLNGQVVWLSISGKPVFDADGDFMGYRGTGTDITKRKQAEEAALESQARLSGILDIAPEAVITIGEHMNIRLFNQSAERIFGYRSDEVLGQSLEILMPKYFRDDHRMHVEGFDSSKDTYRLMGQRQEIIGLRKDGTEFPASASVSKLEISGEKIFTVMMQDITERRQTEEDRRKALVEAEQANQAKSEFLATMSHEFRTPLNAILGFADIISHQYLGPIDDKYKEYAEDIETSGEHLMTLVNEILDLSTIEAGKQSLVKENLSPMEMVTECVRVVETRARSNGIDLVSKVPKDLPPLYADKRAVKQILLNLLSNAVKFTPQGGKITVSVKSSKRNMTLKIADTGKGIPPEKLPKLTDPFTRIGGDPYLAEKGWGLGLAITKSLIDLHDGTLDIKSTVGKGTTITVTFPNGAP